MSRWLRHATRIFFLSAFFYGMSPVGAAPLSRCTVVEETFLSGVLPSGLGGPFLEHYLVVLPKGYQSNLHYGAVYFLHGAGRDRHFITDLGLCTQLDAAVDQGKTPFMVVAPDGGNNYWMNGALTLERWGDMVTTELIADVERKYPLIGNVGGRMIAGNSMGGHGAVQLALNHPGTYSAIGAHSPVFRTEAQARNDYSKQFGAGIDFENRDPLSLMTLLGKQITVPIYVDMGAQDPWINSTTYFASLLRKMGCLSESHVGEDLNGGHADGYWAYHLGSYVDWYSRHLPSPQ